MKALNVSYFRQKQEKDCLLACVKMVADYHGKSVHYDEMLKQFPVFTDVGLYLPQVAQFFIKKGYSTDIATLNPHLFNTKDIGKTQDHVAYKIMTYAAQNDDFILVKQMFLDYIGIGGRVTPTILTKKTIVDEINNGRPVITLLCSHVIYGHDKGFNFHASVIIGHKNNEFIVHDPAPLERHGGTHAVNQDLLVNAIHANSYTDLDNGAILKVAK